MPVNRQSTGGRAALKAASKEAQYFVMLSEFAGANATKNESKHPENASAAMRFRS